MKKKILFFDFDGTIRSDRSGLIPESAREILHRLRKAGHLLILNTGRTKAILDPVTYTLDFDGRILGCGSYVELQNEVLYQAEVAPELHEELLATMKKYEVEAFLEGSEQLYITEDITSGRLLHHIKDYKEKKIPVLPAGKGMSFQKLFIYYRNPSLEPMFKAYITQYFEYIERGKQCVELVIKDHSKATGIAKVLAAVKMAKEDSYVFGDSNNDVPMFDYISNSILIGGENPELKDRVMYAAEDVDHDGLFKAVYDCGILS